MLKTNVNSDSNLNQDDEKLLTPYHRKINGVVFDSNGNPVDGYYAVIDVYDVLFAYRDSIGNPALEHAIKKCLCAGTRGHKNREIDMKEIYNSVKRAIDIEEKYTENPQQHYKESV